MYSEPFEETQECEHRICNNRGRPQIYPTYVENMEDEDEE